MSIEERISKADSIFTGRTEHNPPEKAEPVSPRPTNGSATNGSETTPQPARAEDLRARWAGIQAGFVDEPRVAVQQADELVAAAVKRMEEGIAQQRNALGRQWDGDGASTEDLRVTLRKYRAFFEGLLTVQTPTIE